MKKFHGIRPPIPYKKNPIYTKLNYQGEWYSDCKIDVGDRCYHKATKSCHQHDTAADSDWWHHHFDDTQRKHQCIPDKLLFCNFECFLENECIHPSLSFTCFSVSDDTLVMIQIYCSLGSRKYFKRKFELSLVLSKSSLLSGMALIDWSIRFSDSNRKYYIAYLIWSLFRYVSPNDGSEIRNTDFEKVSSRQHNEFKSHE